MFGTNINRIKNKEIQKNNSSGVNGVTYHKGNKKWYARITFKGKTYGLGYYDDLEDAVNARKAAEKKIFDTYVEETTKKKIIDI